LQEDLWEGLGDPDCLLRRCGPSCTTSTRHCTDSPSPRYLDLTGTLGITPLFVCGLWSRNLVRCLPFERDTVGDMRTIAYLRPYLFRIVHAFWTARGCVVEVSFHAPLRFEREFRHHLSVVLRIHTLPCKTCIGRIAGRCCRNSVSNRSGAWKLMSPKHPRVGLGPILTY
jgi:hypothetical protein